MRDQNRRLVLGLGNPDRGDDAVGRAVARLLRGALPADVEIAESDGEASSLLAKMEGAAEAFLVDACVSGAPSGTVRRFDAATLPLPPATFGVSTHGFGLAEAIELGRTLGRLPRRCIIYAIEAKSFAAGASLSPPVAMAVAETVLRLRAELIQGAVSV